MSELIKLESGRLWVNLPDVLDYELNHKIELLILGQLKDGINNVVIDFSGVAALYSSGLGLLIRLRKIAMEAGGSVSLVNVCTAVRHLLLTLNLDRVFNIFPTDVEFELSQNDLWLNQHAQNDLQFLFFSQVEQNVCRIVISGKMIIGRDYSACSSFSLVPGVDIYIFDLTSLELIDSIGYEELRSITGNIVNAGCECRAFGASELIEELLILLGTDKMFNFYDFESDAIGNSVAEENLEL